MVAARPTPGPRLAKQANPGTQVDRVHLDYRIVRADPADDPVLVELLERFVTPTNAALRHDWLYHRNPQGPAATWFALEPKHSEIIGFTSIFAREFSIRGEAFMGGVGLDAFVRPDHRRRGIAVALHQASLDAMQSGEVPYRFMCGPPVSANLGALIKAGSHILGTAKFFSLPLNIDSLLGTRSSRSERVARFVERVDRFFRFTYKVARRLDGPITVLPIEGPHREIDRLWFQNAPRFGVMGLRDMYYVDWRYLRNPMCTQRVMSILDRGRWIGWAAVELAPRGCLIVDALFEGGEEGRALRALIEWGLAQGAPRLAVFTMGSSTSNRLLLAHGFIPGRYEGAVQLLCPGIVPDALRRSADWYFRAGDLDPESCRWSMPDPHMPWTDPNYIATSEQMS
jgi:GNAT superfamily N-acetyltransferase